MSNLTTIDLEHVTGGTAIEPSQKTGGPFGPGPFHPGPLFPRPTPFPRPRPFPFPGPTDQPILG